MTNYFLKRLSNELIEEIGLNETHKLFFETARTVEKTDIFNQDKIFDIWNKALPDGFKMKKAWKKLNRNFGDLPRTEMDMVDFFYKDIESLNMERYMEFLVMTKAQRVKAIKGLFDKDVTNAIGLPMITLTGYTYDYDGYKEDFDYYLVLAKEGIFVQNGNYVVEFDKIIDSLLTRNLINDDEKTLNENLLEALYPIFEIEND